MTRRANGVKSFVPIAIVGSFALELDGIGDHIRTGTHNADANSWTHR